MGAVERWNRTLKDMLNKNIQEHGNEWDVHLPYLLFCLQRNTSYAYWCITIPISLWKKTIWTNVHFKEFWTGEREIPTSGLSLLKNT
ncbi:hypothetical protein TNCV_2421491 [Trichonephila clavipes]|nr:hypothetical protein TNCV_2421491 [Trichonephila clavipes]